MDGENNGTPYFFPWNDLGGFNPLFLATPKKLGLGDAFRISLVRTDAAVVISDGSTRLRGADGSQGTDFWGHFLWQLYGLENTEVFVGNVAQEMVSDRNSGQVDILHSLVVKIRLGNYCRWRVMISGSLACEQPFAGTPNSEGVSLLTRIMYYSRCVLEWKRRVREKDVFKKRRFCAFFGCFEVRLLI